MSAPNFLKEDREDTMHKYGFISLSGKRNAVCVMR